MSDILQLIPGNWFSIRSYDISKTIPYDVDTLKDEMIKQLESKSENLSIVKLDYGTKNIESKITDIKFDITEDKMARIKKAMDGQQKHPIITFHGTSEEAMHKILKTEYQIGGKGVRAKHGSAYGVGVYSSPHIGKAYSYASSTAKDYAYILINIMVLGKTQLQVAGIKQRDDIDTLMVSGMDQFVSKKSDYIIPIGYYVIQLKN